MRHFQNPFWNVRKFQQGWPASGRQHRETNNFHQPASHEFSEIVSRGKGKNLVFASRRQIILKLGSTEQTPLKIWMMTDIISLIKSGAGGIMVTLSADDLLAVVELAIAKAKDEMMPLMVSAAQ